MLDAVMAVYGRPVQYLSPDDMVTLEHLVGALLRVPVALDPDAENSGGVPQMRTVLRLRASDFPDGAEPEQGALVTVDGERSLVSDVLFDPRGWYDLPLAAAPG